MNGTCTGVPCVVQLHRCTEDVTKQDAVFLATIPFIRLVIHQRQHTDEAISMSNEQPLVTDNVNDTLIENLDTMVVIRPESPLHPKLAPLWQAKEALSRSLYPAESDFSYSPSALCAPNIRFLVVEMNGEFVGCGAAVDHGDYGELKSMFVLEAMRGQRIGERLIYQLEAFLRERGLTVARLETGVDSHSALRLYARLGYQRCDPFGDYPADPLCVFMEKRL